MTSQDQARLLELINLTEQAVERLTRLMGETGVEFQVQDVVQAVEDLRNDFGTLTIGHANRRVMIARLAQDILNREPQ